MTPQIPSVLKEALDGHARPQEPFRWKKQPWLDQMHDLPDVVALVERLPDRVSRQSTLDAVSTAMNTGGALPAFIAVMIWGWGTAAGMGALRTRWILTQTKAKSAHAISEAVDPLVAKRLKAGARSAYADGALEAFRLMNNEGRILHLGPSYFTKWLYFTSAVDGPYDSKAAPILDDRIVEWLKDSAGVRLERNRTSSYSEYLDLLASWGEPYGRTRVQVETEIFRLATGRG